MVPGIEPEFAVSKASALPRVVDLWPLRGLFTLEGLAALQSAPSQANSQIVLHLGVCGLGRLRQCSGLISGSLFRDHCWWCLVDHIQWPGFELGSAMLRQARFLLHSQTWCSAAAGCQGGMARLVQRPLLSGLTAGRARGCLCLLPPLLEHPQSSPHPPTLLPEGNAHLLLPEA